MENKKIILVSLALIAVLGITAYANSLNGQFIWDDDHLVRNNAYIRSWSHISDIFSKDIGAGAGKKYSAYRPAQVLSYALDYSLWGSNPKDFRITNLALHILTALAVFWLVTILFKKIYLSLLTSILFVVHPVQTEAVAYISGRADLLAALFILLTLVFYIKNLQARSLVVNALMVTSYFLALLSRENSVVLILLLFLYHYCFAKKIDLELFAPVAALTLFYLFVRLTFLKPILPELHTVTTTALDRAPGFFVALVSYVRLFFLPLGLHMEYGNRLYSFGDPRALFGLAVFIALCIYACKKRKACPLIFFSVGWFFITLAPVSNIFFPVNAYMAEHWLYLPSVGFFLLLSSWLTSLADKNFKVPAVMIAVLLVASYACLTIRQNAYWDNPLGFFERTIRYAQQSSRVHYDFANFLESQGRYAEAIGHYKRAIELDPNDALACNNLAIAYFESGEEKKATEWFKRAIQIDPNYKDARYNLGLAVSKQKKFNVLLVAIDALRPDHLGCYGYSRDTSPNIDAFAKEGVRFNNAFSSGAGTRIAVASLLTSLYPSVHRVYALDSSLDAKFTTLAEVLKENGFTTAVFSPDNIPSSYNLFQGFDSVNELPHSSDSAGKTTDKVLAWVKQNSKTPFFIYVHYFGLHAPYIVPAAYERLFWKEGIDRKMRSFLRDFALSKTFNPKARGMHPDDRMVDYLISQYDAKIRYTDDSLGELFKRLEESGSLGNTLVILTSDHGEELMDHGDFFHEQSLYDELIRVPLIIRLPEAVRQSKTISQSVRHIDIMPTILEIVGIEPDSAIQGNSLLSLIEGGDVPEEEVFSEAFYAAKHMKAVRGGGWKLIQITGAGLKTYELYDLKKDPREADNIYSANPQASGFFKSRLVDYDVSCTRLRDSILGQGDVPTTASLKEETRERLKSLGYVQ